MALKCLKKLGSLAAVVCLCGGILLVCGCDVALPEVSQSEPTRTALVLLNVDLASLLSKEEIEDAMDATVRDPQITNEGRTLFAISTGGKASLSVSVEQSTLEKFRASLPRVMGEELQEAPNLAQEAWWLASGRTLFLYARGYTVSVAVTDRTVDEESVLLAARKIAALLCGRLPEA